MLSPSLCVILSEAKNLSSLRVNSAKHLSWLRINSANSLPLLRACPERSEGAGSEPVEMLRGACPERE